MKIIFVILTLCMLTGCYDNKETDSLAVVMAVGIDASGEEKEYTFAVADNSGFAEKSSGDSAGLVCFSQKAKNIENATKYLDGNLSKKLSLSHLSAVIFSEESARNSMYEDIDYFESKVYVRPQVMIGVCQKTASDYLESLKPRLETNPEKYFRSIFDSKDSRVTDLRIIDFTNAYHKDKRVLAPYIIVNGKENLTETKSYINGSAVIKNGKCTEIINTKGNKK